MGSVKKRGIWISSMMVVAAATLAVASLIGSVGAIGVVGGGKNPAQLGTLHWFEANKTFGNFAVGTNPREMVFDGSSVWVANFGSNNVKRLNTQTGAVTATTAVGTGPLGLAFDGTNIWVSNFTSNNVTKVNATTGVASAPITVGTHPWGVAFDGTNIWVTEQRIEQRLAHQPDDQSRERDVRGRHRTS